MNLVSSRRNGKITMKDAAPPAGKKLRILSALNGVAGNGEGASSRAEMIALPSRTTTIYVGGGSISHHRAKNLPGSVARSSSDHGRRGAFVPASPAPFLPDKNRSSKYGNRSKSGRHCHSN